MAGGKKVGVKKAGAKKVKVAKKAGAQKGKVAKKAGGAVGKKGATAVKGKGKVDHALDYWHCLTSVVSGGWDGSRR